MLQRLSELRKMRKWSLQDTADQLGIAKSTYAGYESGYREPSLQSLSQIANLFETTVDYILGRTEEDDAPIELINLIKDSDHKLSLDGELLSRDEIIEFAAFVRAKRSLKSENASTDTEE
ncbi:helix-turn-helix transcriptional regulator [Bacillus sp. BRMEA1]|uniref:helix-turn-helix domain-containing protein n=1 Tax=Neobacillus endophyticus TaxID=2738405 RepID=UPI00156481A2|nr:helix-turn-helix transcriptional regulator [Neobacillus endophyticus]NRD77334.1 helix-turn-helix transcriptional regulator [Neobacillus endophyticus]